MSERTSLICGEVLLGKKDIQEKEKSAGKYRPVYAEYRIDETDHVLTGTVVYLFPYDGAVWCDGHVIDRGWLDYTGPDLVHRRCHNAVYH